MSIFQQKLKEFMSTPWDNQIDISLNNQLIKQKNDMMNDQMGAQQFIGDFITNNAQLVARSTPKFQELINLLPTYMTESEYNGVWDTISMLIRRKDNSDINPEVIARIKKFAKEKYNIVVRPDIETPKSVLLVPNFKMADGYIKFEKLLQKIDPELKTDITTLPTTKHNKAAQVNKANAEKEKIKSQQDEYNYVMENKEILLPTVKDVYGKVTEMLNEADIAYEQVSLNKFIEKNFKKVKNICENYTSSLDTMRLYALMESTDLKENDTADISVPEMAVTSSIMRKRLNNFNPFGKNIANTSGDTKTVIKMDADVLQESIKKLNFNKTVIIGTDIETSTKYSRVIVESESKKQELTIDRTDFLKFVKNNADVSKYMSEGKLNVGKYFESRTSGFVSTLIKEYFKSLIKEDAGQDFQINDFQINGNTLNISYFYPHDEVARDVQTDLDGFIDFLKSKYDTEEFYTHDENDVSMENPRGSYTFDFNAFWDTFDIREQNMLVKQYMLTKNAGSVNESKNVSASRSVEDYNQWKDIIATDSRNEFTINEGIAKDSKGKILGEWDRNGKKGYIYK